MRVEKLLQDCRLISDNIGGAISDDEIILFLNTAQERLQGLILQEHPENQNFAMEAFITMQPNQDTYPLDEIYDSNGTALKERFFSVNAINTVEIDSATGVFQPLNKITSRERMSGYGYFIRSKYLTITPVPSATGRRIRLTGMQKLFRLDKVRGAIGSITTVGSDTQLGLTSIPSGTDFQYIDKISIVNEDGEVILNNLKIKSFSTPNLLISGSLSGVTTDHYIVYGGYSTSQFLYDSMFEKYLFEYVSMRIFMRDSSADITSQRALVQAIEKEIIDTISLVGDDAQLVPILTTDYIFY